MFGCSALAAAISGALAQPNVGSPGDDQLIGGAVDSIAVAGLSRYHVPGAALVVVRNGRIVLERGYGVADVDSRLPVSPESTLFGVSSISKVFTATAVMQLVEKGQVALDSDVNAYLERVRVPPTFDRPVTLAHLLTHTAGFDDRGIGVAARRADDVVPLAAYLARDMPPRVRPAGQVASYSNHGFALAGLVVEQVSGVPFAGYVRAHILDPLGMTRSGFEQPLRNGLESARATAYEYRAGRFVRVPRIFFNDTPASALFVTAHDMALFMNAQLERGANTQPGILSASSLATMHRQQFTHHPRLPGLAYGFRERFDGGQRVLQQGGDWQDYSSEMYLLPELRLGVFVAFNSGDGHRLAEEIWRSILPQYAAPKSHGRDTEHGTVRSEGEARALTGTYRLNRYSRHTIGKLGALTGAIPEYEVKRGDDSLLALSTTLRPIEPLLYRRDDTRELVAFRRGSRDQATHFFAEDGPYAAFERVAWYAVSSTHLVAFAVCAVSLLGAALLSIAMWWRARRRGRGDPRAGTGTHDRARRYPGTAAAVVAVACLGCLAVFVALLMSLARVDIWEFQYGLPDDVRTLLTVALVVPALALALVGRVAIAWRHGEWSRTARAVHTVAAVASLGFAALLWYWNLLAVRA